MTLMCENIEEVVAFVELAKELNVDFVGLWHLNQMPDAEMARYSIDRDDWHFEYAEQGLWHFPELSNRMVGAAVKRAEELGVPLQFDPSKNVFFEETATGSISEPVPTKQEEVETVKDCTHPWDALLISSDGAVRACCYSKQLGNINGSDFDAIWNGDAMQALRRDLANNVVSDVCREAPCKYVNNTRALQAATAVVSENPAPAVEQSKRRVHGFRKLLGRLIPSPSP